MSYVIAAPDLMTSAAADLAAIGSNVSAAHLVAAARTAAVVPAAADEVSTSIAHLFSQHAASYQALAGQAAAFNGQFVQHLTAGAFSYADIEAAIASLLQDANGLVGLIASIKPEEFYVGAFVLLSSPIWLPVVGLAALIVVPVVGLGALVVLYWLSTNPVL
jgi:hypothetical protein